MSSLKVHYNNNVSSYDFEPGANLLDFLRDRGYEINATCGGNGKCGKCSVKLVSGDSEETVLACSTFLTDDCEVYLRAESNDIFWNDSISDVTSIKAREGFGAAVDIGTTTVAIQLYDLSNGEDRGSLSRWNMQKSFGGDVISRISHCMDNPDGITELSSRIRHQIMDMLGELCSEAGVGVADVKEMFLAGNTVMEHIFAGISPDSIAVAPFTPASLFDKGEAVMLESIPVFLAPCVAGYVGGDISAGILACGLNTYDGKALFLDIGTNGEMALGGRNGIVTCAVASGPAFEGAGIACGMPAATGAINHVRFNDDKGRFDYETVGNTEASGICGSGLLDLTAGLLELEYIDEGGFLENDEGENVYYITDRVYLNQKDIRQLQLAKAAIAAGITRLMETEHVGFDDIGALYLAGGFGMKLRGESAVRIGMLPRELQDKIVPLGNTSLTGASQALLEPEKRQELLRIKANCRYLELSSDKGFNDCYIDNMGFDF